MRRGRILQDMKSGKIHDIFHNNVSVLKKLLSDKKQKKDGHIISLRASGLYSFLVSLRFTYIFIVNDYDDLARSLSVLDRFAFPDDLKSKSRLDEFNRQIGHLLDVHLSEEIKKRLKHFSPVEVFRLDEALITLKTEAYLSSIVMSVSAAENRLHNIVQKQLPRQYKKDNLAKAPLGSLLSQINSNKKYRKIKEQLSEKFPSLLTMCNHYRIFSAHPKQEIMTYQDALAIFGLVMSFLLVKDYW